MATTTLVTVQEFLQLPESEGQHLELIGGEIVDMGRGQSINWTNTLPQYRIAALSFLGESAMAVPAGCRPRLRRA